jgi:hypothetical protein
MSVCDYIILELHVFILPSYLILLCVFHLKTTDKS